jgi:hypothetical protein
MGGTKMQIFRITNVSGSRQVIDFTGPRQSVALRPAGTYDLKSILEISVRTKAMLDHQPPLLRMTKMTVPDPPAPAETPTRRHLGRGPEPKAPDVKTEKTSKNAQEGPQKAAEGTKSPKGTQGSPSKAKASKKKPALTPKPAGKAKAKKPGLVDRVMEKITKKEAKKVIKAEMEAMMKAGKNLTKEGKPEAPVLKERIQKINPNIEVDSKLRDKLFKEIK